MVLVSIVFSPYYTHESVFLQKWDAPQVLPVFMLKSALCEEHWMTPLQSHRETYSCRR
jgi:hypothetical protein